MQDYLPWIVGGNALLTLMTAVYALVTSGAKKTAGDLDAYKTAQGTKLTDIEKRLSEHGSRLQQMESDLGHLPGKDAVHRLELALSEMKVEIVKIGASADQSARTAARVENYLLEKGA